MECECKFYEFVEIEDKHRLIIWNYGLKDIYDIMESPDRTVLIELLSEQYPDAVHVEER